MIGTADLERMYSPSKPTPSPNSGKAFFSSRHFGDFKELDRKNDDRSDPSFFKDVSEIKLLQRPIIIISESNDSVDFSGHLKGSSSGDKSPISSIASSFA